MTLAYLNAEYVRTKTYADDVLALSDWEKIVKAKKTSFKIQDKNMDGFFEDDELLLDNFFPVPVAWRKVPDESWPEDLVRMVEQHGAENDEYLGATLRYNAVDQVFMLEHRWQHPLERWTRKQTVLLGTKGGAVRWFEME